LNPARLPIPPLRRSAKRPVYMGFFQSQRGHAYKANNICAANMRQTSDLAMAGD